MGTFAQADSVRTPLFTGKEGEIRFVEAINGVVCVWGRWIPRRKTLEAVVNIVSFKLQQNSNLFSTLFILCFSNTSDQTLVKLGTNDDLIQPIDGILRPNFNFLTNTGSATMYRKCYNTMYEFTHETAGQLQRYLFLVPGLFGQSEFVPMFDTTYIRDLK
eukprot:gb/GECG01015280.1/.p1 GENE.gb/GECG01015280.1/~~gb/GECG01015280.1/.p1  ORF type:complete len:160 (+),score=9.32 gb/GECG01015280.1/:1-480(+)